MRVPVCSADFDSLLRNSAMRRIFIVCIVMLFLGNVQAYATESLNVLTEEWPPYNYSLNGEVTGLSTDLVKQVIERAGYDYRISIKPWKRAYNEALETRNTLLYTTSRTEKREKLFKWVGPLYPRRVVLFRLKRNTSVEVNSLDDLRKYRIGVLRGGSVEEYLVSKGFTKEKNLDLAATGKQNILKLFLDRIDLIPGSEMNMVHQISQTIHDYSELEVAYVLIEQGGLYLAVNKDTSDEIVDKIQKAFDSLLKEGVRDEIVNNYVNR